MVLMVHPGRSRYSNAPDHSQYIRPLVVSSQLDHTSLEDIPEASLTHSGSKNLNEVRDEF